MRGGEQFVERAHRYSQKLDPEVTRVRMVLSATDIMETVAAHYECCVEGNNKGKKRQGRKECGQVCGDEGLSGIRQHEVGGVIRGRE